MTLEHLFVLLPVGSTVEVTKMIGNLRYDVRIGQVGPRELGLLGTGLRNHYGRSALLGNAIDKAYKSYLNESPSHTSIKKSV